MKLLSPSQRVDAIIQASEAKRQIQSITGLDCEVSIKINPPAGLKGLKLEELVYTIKKACADAFFCKVSDIDGRSRSRNIVDARHAAYFILQKKVENITLKKIGLFFDGREHSTILKGLEKVSDLLQTDKQFRKKVEQIQDVLAEAKVAVINSEIITV